MTSRSDKSDSDPWPRLDVSGHAETSQSLLLWGQILGKTRLALSPMVNHWWQVPLMVTARGLSTTPMPIGDRVLDIELDFIDHRLVARTSDGAVESMSLCDQALSGFHAEYMGRLTKLGVSVTINPIAVEMVDLVRLDRDARVCRYDPDWSNRFFRALIQADRLLKEFRGRFVGKASPVHFFWGGFDLAVTRFSGRRARLFTTPMPGVSLTMMQEAYSHEVSSAGFWPGGNGMDASFYSYAYPVPEGFAQSTVRPHASYFSKALGEF